MSFKVSALVSTYNREKFFASRLTNLFEQTLASVEVIVIDSGSEQNEAAIAKQFQRQYPDRLTYIRTEREGLYATWNRAIKLARGEYLTSANTDDRLALTALESMSEVLDDNASVALCYSDMYVTTAEQDIIDFKQLTAQPSWKQVSWPEYSHKQLLVGCFCGPHPVWRKRLHEEFGGFDESFVAAGDYEFWLRIAEGYRFARIAEPLCVCLHNSRGITWCNQELLMEENLKIRKKYLAMGAQGQKST